MNVLFVVAVYIKADMISENNLWIVEKLLGDDTFSVRSWTRLKEVQSLSFTSEN